MVLSDDPHTEIIGDIIIDVNKIGDKHQQAVLSQ